MPNCNCFSVLSFIVESRHLLGHTGSTSLLLKLLQREDAPRSDASFAGAPLDVALRTAVEALCGLVLGEGRGALKESGFRLSPHGILAPGLGASKTK